MRYGDGSQELYDMKNDPGQIHNLAAAPQHRATVKRLSVALDARLASAGIKPKASK